MDNTPYEMHLMLKARQDQQKRDQDERITLAYMNAYWTALWMSGRRPDSLDKILGREPEQRDMTDNEMFAVVLALHQAMTGEVN